MRKTLDVISEYGRLCGFEPITIIPNPIRVRKKSGEYVSCQIGIHDASDVHDFVCGKGGGDGRDDVRSPGPNVFGDSFAFDHDHLKRARYQPNGPVCVSTESVVYD